jgi:hypothetical protein
MKTLLEQSRDAEALLDAILSLGQREVEFDALNERLKALEQASKGLDAAGERISVLRESGIEPSGPGVKADRALEKTRDVITRFKANRSSQTLTMGRQWRSLLEELDNIKGSACGIADSTWSNFSQQCLLESPQNIEPRLPPTADNLKAFDGYKKLHRQLSERLLLRPQSKTDITVIRELVADMKSRYSEIDFDYPPELTAFLRAAASSQGVLLSEVKRNVLDGLQERGLLDKFTVRNRS